MEEERVGRRRGKEGESIDEAPRDKEEDRAWTSTTLDSVFT